LREASCGRLVAEDSLEHRNTERISPYLPTSPHISPHLEHRNTFERGNGRRQPAACVASFPLLRDESRLRSDVFTPYRVLASPPFRRTAAALRSRGRAGFLGGAVTPGARATRARRAACRRPRRRRLCAGSRRRARRSPSTCAPRRATPFSSRRGCGTAAGPTARVRTGGCTTASTRAAPSEGRRLSASRCGPGRRRAGARLR